MLGPAVASTSWVWRRPYVQSGRRRTAPSNWFRRTYGYVVGAGLPPRPRVDCRRTYVCSARQGQDCSHELIQAYVRVFSPEGAELSSRVGSGVRTYICPAQQVEQDCSHELCVAYVSINKYVRILGPVGAGLPLRAVRDVRRT